MNKNQQTGISSCVNCSKGVRLINRAAVRRIYTTNSSHFFFLSANKKKKHLIIQRAACLRRDDLCRQLLMAKK